MALVPELRSEGLAANLVKPQGDKAARLSVASGKFEAGPVFVPRHACWLPDLEAEPFPFPGGKHDGQCDSISHALEPNSFKMPTLHRRRQFERPKCPANSHVKTCIRRRRACLKRSALTRRANAANMQWPWPRQL
jgi:hypothetical protein